MARPAGWRCSTATPSPFPRDRAIAPEPKLLRDACRLAVEVARDGELAEPRLPAPAGIRTVLGFSRMSKSAYAIVRRAIDDDETFRARVAAAADEGGEDTVGRAGWLWLHRPEGWATDPALDADEPAESAGRGSARLRRERDGAEAAAARYRQGAEVAEASRRRAVEQLADLRTDLAGARTDRAELSARLEVLEAERNQAVRTQKRVEADLASARRDLRLAREAAREAEADLLEARSSHGGPGGGRVGASRGDRGGGETSPARPSRSAGAAPEDPNNRRAQESVAAASTAVAELVRALAAAAEALGLPGDPARDGGEPESQFGGSGRATTPAGGLPAPRSKPAGRSAGRSAGGSGGRSGARSPGRPPERSRGGRRARSVAPLPPGVFDGTAEANRALVRSPDLLVVVDGYNLAREAWADLEPEEERRRTVALLEEVAARSGASVTVVFDGVDDTIAPAASRSVRVRFSRSGETADDAIAALLRTVRPSQPILVVSSDREVADDARRQGATALSSRHFLAAAGRSA